MRPITPINNHGSIQLKFSVSRKRYSFNPIPGGRYDNELDYQVAQQKATAIQLDILAGNFNPTLDRYRCVIPYTVSRSESELRQYKTPLDLFDAWISTLDLEPGNYAKHHSKTRKMLEQVTDIRDTRWLTKSDICASTFRERLRYVRSCCDWAVRQGYLDTNPYTDIKPRRETHKDVSVFSDDEAQAIVEGFERYVPHYTSFVKFLLLTGVRISEAIGLRWEHIDLDKGVVVIRESLSIDKAGDGYKRIRKARKTGTVTYLTINQELHHLLSSQPKRHKDLVFTSIGGKVISSNNFRERYWSQVLRLVGVPYRVPNTTRHNLASHALEQGIPITGVAYLLGHKDTTMVMKTYGHLVNRPELTNIKLD